MSTRAALVHERLAGIRPRRRVRFPLDRSYWVHDYCRPPRSAPTLDRLSRYLGQETPACWRCGDTEYLEMAHVITRMYCGLDTLANLRPLCSSCHMAQPDFTPDEVDAALAWFSRRRPGIWDLMEDAIQEMRRPRQLELRFPKQRRRPREGLWKKSYDYRLEMWAVKHGYRWNWKTETVELGESAL